MAKKIEIELKVGLFVSVGIALIAMAILVLGGTDSFFARKNHYTAHLPSAEGLIPGAKVVLGGIPVGTVESIHFDGDRHEIGISFSVEHNSAKWIRADSNVQLMTQGMLGDKFISISAGSIQQKEIPNGEEVTFSASKDLSQFISKGDQLLISLNSISTDLDKILHAFERQNRAETFFENMAQSARGLNQVTEKLNKQLDGNQLHSALVNLNSILEKVNTGNGTLGALVNDPALYDNVKSLVGGANRNRVIRNLVRKTVETGEDSSSSSSKSKK